MDLQLTEPIPRDWTSGPARTTSASRATAVDAVHELSHLEIDDVDGPLLPLLAAAAAELAGAAGLAWRIDGDPPVVLVRLIARIAGRNPCAAGPDTARLVHLLRERRRAR